MRARGKKCFAGSYFAKGVFIATSIVFADEGPLNDCKARASVGMTAAAVAVAVTVAVVAPQP